MNDVTTELLRNSVAPYKDIVFVSNDAQMLKYIC